MNKKVIFVLLMLLFSIVLSPQIMSFFSWGSACDRWFFFFPASVYDPDNPYSALDAVQAGRAVTISAFNQRTILCDRPIPPPTCDNRSYFMDWHAVYRIEYGPNGDDIRWPTVGMRIFEFDGYTTTTEITSSNQDDQWSRETTWTIIPECQFYPCDYSGTIYSGMYAKIGYQDPGDNCRERWVERLYQTDEYSIRPWPIDLPPPGPEICDGIDNDQDGFVDATDENGDGHISGVEIGCDNDNDDYCEEGMTYNPLTYTCSDTKQCCTAGNDCIDDYAGGGSSFVARLFHPGEYEYCDGLDNNCIGGADEGCPVFGGASLCDCRFLSGGTDTCGAGMHCTSDENASPGGMRCIPQSHSFGLYGICVPDAIQECQNGTGRPCGISPPAGQWSNASWPCRSGWETCNNGFFDGQTCSGVNPEIEICDNIDNDCDHTIDEGCDTDGDDYCTDQMGFNFYSDKCPLSQNGTPGVDPVLLDCQDGFDQIHPRAQEKCGAISSFWGALDFDCDGDTENGCDDDDDDYCDANLIIASHFGSQAHWTHWQDYGCQEGSPRRGQQGCCPLGDPWHSGTEDCDDDNPNIYPGAPEICGNGIDENCDGSDAICPWAPGTNCNCESGFELAEYECFSPGDGWVCSAQPEDSPDEVYCVPTGASPELNGWCVPYCEDFDGDGDGTPEPCYDLGTPVQSGNDCNDRNAAISSLATEICDGLDNNCDGEIDEGCDRDDDDWCAAGMNLSDPYVCLTRDPFCCYDGINDCNDFQASVYPGAEEKCDGLDNDCDGFIDATDVDGDGDIDWDDESCDNDNDGYCDGDLTIVPGYQCREVDFSECCNASLPPDCDDRNSGINPGRDERCDWQTVDENCNGVNNSDEVDLNCECLQWDWESCGTDVGECFYGERWCWPNGTWSNCNWEYYSYYRRGNGTPAKEICNDLDDDCDGEVDNGCNEDGDSFCVAGSNMSALNPSTCSAGEGDCDDTNINTYPGAPEVCDGIANDCNFPGTIDVDPLGDPLTRLCYNGPAGTIGVGRCRGGQQTCSGGSWGSTCTGEILPLSQEIICNGVDDNCNGLVDEGAYNCSTYCPAGGFDTNSSKLVVRNNGVEVAEMDGNGMWLIDGLVYDNTDSADIPSASFNVKNHVGERVAAINGSGDIYLQGDLYQLNPAMTRSVQQEMVIKSGDQILAIFDTDGNMFTAGCVSMNFTADCDENDLACAYCTASASVVPTGAIIEYSLNGPVDTMPASDVCILNSGDQNNQVTAATCDANVTYQYNIPGIYRPYFHDGLGNDVDCPIITVGQCVPAPCLGRCGMVNDGCGDLMDCGTCCTPTTPSLDVCDGLDNDCDGTVDNGVGCPCTTGMTRPCGTDEGECTAGIEQCVAGQWDSSTCTASPNPFAAEACNGLDDDCDGAIDNDVICGCADPSDTRQCGTDEGECSIGFEVCGDDLFFDGVTCEGQTYVPRVQETCDGLDNDCDGIPDNGCNCVTGTYRPCGMDMGECSVGQEQCIAGNWDSSTCDAMQPRQEICDNLDNNCNGLPDDGLDTCAPCTDGDRRPCSIDEGVCLAGEEVCSGGVWGLCSGTLPDEEPETLCDGIDNNCDGRIDETCNCQVGESRICGADVGECAFGEQFCVNGDWDLTCVGGQASTNEVCNGLDDDCNGFPDDNLPFIATTCNNGDCVGGGNIECRDGVPFDTCTARQPTLEEIDPCNGIDDDCNDGVDENMSCACQPGERRQCGSTSLGVCEIGYEECPTYPPFNFSGINDWWTCDGWQPAWEDVETTCNNRDDDCDGLTDADDPDVGSCPCTPGETMSCSQDGPGECVEGVLICNQAGAWPSLTDFNCKNGTLPVEPRSWRPDGEYCDGLDNNCDGTLYIPTQDAYEWDAALYPGRSDGFEDCDGFDNDCNGEIDYGVRLWGQDWEEPWSTGTEICGDPQNRDENCDGIAQPAASCGNRECGVVWDYCMVTYGGQFLRCGDQDGNCSKGSYCNWGNGQCEECRTDQHCENNTDARLCRDGSCVECDPANNQAGLPWDCIQYYDPPQGDFWQSCSDNMCFSSQTWCQFQPDGPGSTGTCSCSGNSINDDNCISPCEAECTGFSSCDCIGFIA